MPDCLGQAWTTSPAAALGTQRCKAPLDARLMVVLGIQRDKRRVRRSQGARVEVRRRPAPSTYLEPSIAPTTQWAVLDPNNERLWTSIRQSIGDLLLVPSRSGGLMGNRPEEAYFVRCDRIDRTRTTSTTGG